MQISAPHQTPGDVSGLQRRALRRRMRREIAGDRDEDAPALIRVAPEGELPDPRLQHLVGMEARVFPKHRARERGDQRLRRIPELQVPRHEPRREIDLSLSIIRVEQCGADPLLVGGQIVEIPSFIAGDASRGHVEISSQIEGHGAMQQAARGRQAVDAGSPDPLEHVAKRIGVSEDVMRRLPSPKRATLSAAP